MTSAPGPSPTAARTGTPGPEGVARVRPTPLAVAVVVHLGLIVRGFGVVTYPAPEDDGGSSEASLPTYPSRIVALVVGWLLLDERLPAVALVGFGIVAWFALLASREIAAELARYP